MRRRCLNPRVREYPNYGGRGIKICKRWDDYRLFLKDMGRKSSPKHSLERIDVNRSYTPRNCKWATHLEQQRNRRTTLYVNYHGERISVAKLGAESVVGVELFRSRIQQGWDVERALREPKQKHWQRVKLGTKFPVRRGTSTLRFRGELLTLKQLSEKYGVSRTTMNYRLTQGWSMRRVLGLQP
jgi:hypothetical protein